MKTISIFVAATADSNKLVGIVYHVISQFNNLFSNQGYNLKIVDLQCADFIDNLTKNDLCVAFCWDGCIDYPCDDFLEAYDVLYKPQGNRKLCIYFNDTSVFTDELRAICDSFTKRYEHYSCTFENVDTTEIEFLQQCKHDIVKIEQEDYETIQTPEKVAILLHNLGWIRYCTTDQLEIAEKEFQSALPLFRLLAEKRPEVFDEYVADTLRGIAKLYLSWWDGNCETEEIIHANFQESLNIYIRLAEQNPERYEVYVAHVLNEISCFLGNDIMCDYEQAEALKQDSVAIYQRLVETQPDIFMVPAAKALMDIAKFHVDYFEGYEQQALEEYQAAIAFYREAVQMNPDYRYNLSGGLTKLGMLYGEMQEYEKELACYQEALDIRHQLAESAAGSEDRNIASLLQNMGSAYCLLQQYELAEMKFNEALSIHKSFADKHLESNDTLDLKATTLENLGYMYFNSKQYAKAERCYNEALDIFVHLAEEIPQEFDTIIQNLTNRLEETRAWVQNAARKQARAIHEKFIKFEKQIQSLQEEKAEEWIDKVTMLYQEAIAFAEEQGSAEWKTKFIDAYDYWQKADKIHSEIQVANVQETPDEITKTKESWLSQLFKRKK